MKKVIIGLLGILSIAAALWLYTSSRTTAEDSISFTDTEAGFDAEPIDNSAVAHMNMDDPALLVGRGQYTITELAASERPDGPLRVGLQVGHLNNENPPEELAGLARNGAGAVAGPYNERDTVEVITNIAAEQLRAAGIEVDVLPAIIPPGYVADAFVAIHADGNTNTNVRGYKMAGPRRDYSGKAAALVEALYASYEAGTDIPEDFTITNRMTAYYAFNWARYEHAVHPRTPAAIVELGFLSNPADRAFMLNEPERAATAVANGILVFLNTNQPAEPAPLPLITPQLPLTGTVTCATVRAERRNREPRPCEAALVTSDGNQYLLVAEEPVATSSLPYQATVDGVYRPVQVLDNYFWFHWEVLGLIQEPVITRLE